MTPLPFAAEEMQRRDAVVALAVGLGIALPPDDVGVELLHPRCVVLGDLEPVYLADLGTLRRESVSCCARLSESGVACCMYLGAVCHCDVYLRLKILYVVSSYWSLCCECLALERSRRF